MSSSTATTSSASAYTTPAFWERLWRTAGIQSLLCFIAAYIAHGTTWLTGGFWAPDGVYSRFVWPGVGVVWGMVVSGVLLTRSPATRSGW